MAKYGGWFGAALVLTLGAPATACGDPFTNAANGGDDAAGGNDAADDARDGGLIVDDSGLDGSHDQTSPDARGDATTDGAAEATTPDASMPDTSMQPDTSVMDSPVDTGPQGDACSLMVASETIGVFVSPGGPSSGCGTKATPCGSIQAAIVIAGSTGKSMIYVDHGTYTETVTLASNMTVLGGWIDTGGSWTRQCGVGNAASATIKAPANANKTVVADNVTGAVLDTLTIASKDSGNVGQGESIYGIFATGSTSLSIVNVAVSVVGGGAGGPGNVGANGTNATGTCTASDAAPGSAGAGGTSGTSSFGAGGFTSGTGGTGVQGGTGHAGVQGTPPTCAQVGDCTVNNIPDGCVSAPTPDNLSQSCGTVGPSGCGGGGSFGGSGGTGGGSSIALYAWGATVNLSGGSLSAGNGGNGGNGAAGGSTVGQPSTGTAGMNGFVGATSCQQLAGSPWCRVTASSRGLAGGVGGTGGVGGVGGTGGGGAGGYSYSYYFGGGAAVVPSGTTFNFGTAGGGGSGGQTGASGGAGAHN